MASLFFCLALALFVSSDAWAGSALYVGDSHSYIGQRVVPERNKRLGHHFLEAFEKRGIKIDYYAACGQRPASWATGGHTNCGYTRAVGEEFEALKESEFPAFREIYKPGVHSLVVINLGDNSFRWKKNADGILVSHFEEAQFTREMNTFFQAYSDAKPESCSWVGPTYHIEGSAYEKTDAAVDALYVALAKLVANKCKLIDSRPIVVPKTPNDGLHHTTADSAAWGMGVLKQLP